MKLEDLKRELLQDPSFQEEYEKQDLAFDISQGVLAARIKRGMTQEELARKIGTHQPSIARLERGSTLPSLRLLQRVADALDTKIIPPQFEILQDAPSSNTAASQNSTSETVLSRSLYLKLITSFPDTTNVLHSPVRWVRQNWPTASNALMLEGTVKYD